ncbi:30S ribosomal protein S5 [Novimethylophilus kurashikiensis]|uniref:30S ribosomal protein S5 n=1 Tax=Novimethylophilus kurashikiensis TaxID=1825523 RepID=A0A2R5F7S6_9PROT|nr:hypothetical protein [Novimethylophilus kurashikiensis]GBG14292.1 30S ribosomal protein S5 [Novimethylophilus kurashikiensis]
MFNFIKTVICMLCLAWLFSPQANAGTTYPMFVVAHDIEARQIEGEFRFCERVNLKNGVCYQKVNFFGKTKRMPQDWWSPETYVSAYTGIESPVVVSIEPTADGRGVIIYYQ